MAYNLDVFEHLVFSVPSERRLRGVVVVSGFVYGGITAGAMRILLDVSVTGVAALGLIGAFILPAFVTAIVSRRFPDFKPKWGYCLGFTATTLAFLFLLAELIVGPTLGWRILVFGAAVIFLVVATVFVLAASTEHPGTLLVGSVPMPLVLLALPVVGAARYGLAPLAEVRAALTLGAVGFGLAASVFVHERLFDANVTYIDGSRLTSTLLTERDEDIDTGYPYNPRVQALAIESEEGDSFRFAAPWVHPGPILNFGGGAIAKSIIDELNAQDDDNGFFLKVPSTHEEDPAEVSAAENVLSALPEPSTTAEATRLIERTYNDISFYGRRYGGQRVVLIEPERYGDFPQSVFADCITPDDTLLVDRHAYEPAGERGIRYGSIGAEAFRDALKRFLSDLDEAELYSYSAGVAVDTDEKQVCALVEEVDNQKTVLFGSNENEVSATMRELETSLVNENYDHAVVFSTDTHHSMHDLAARRPVDPEKMRSVIAEAASAVSPARAGVGVARADTTRLLGTEYYSLMYTINYVLRSFTVSLGGLLLLAGVLAFI